MLNAIRRVAGTVALCLIATGAAVAQTPRSYAVLSLVGDKLTMVSPRMTTGSHADRNLRNEIATSDDGLDALAVQAAAQALRQLQPGATPALFTSRDANLFAMQEALVESDDLPAEFGQSLKSLLSSANATHFVLITKYRAETQMRLHGSAVGNGRLSGLGFYVDRHMGLQNVETGVRTTGFFSPYVYMRMTLIDAATLQPVRRWTARATQVISSRPGAIESAWTQYAAAQKTQLLSELLQRSVSEGVEALLAAEASR